VHGFEIYFWALDSVPLMYMTVFIPTPHYLDYCRFMASAGTKNASSPVWSFFMIVLAILGLNF
jgi:hypothetical protein